MKLEELLRHVADNVEAGKPVNHGLLYWGLTSIVDHISCFNWTDHANYSNKPKTHTVNGWEVPTPATQPLDRGQEYLYVDMSHPKWVNRDNWTGHEIDHRRLERRVLFLTQEAAMANAKAMTGINPYGEGVV
jgi:hypothetical protein